MTGFLIGSLRGVTEVLCPAAVYSLTVGRLWNERALVFSLVHCRDSSSKQTDRNRGWNVKDRLWALNTARGLSQRNVRTLNKQRRGSHRVDPDSHTAEWRGFDKGGKFEIRWCKHFRVFHALLECYCKLLKDNDNDPRLYLQRRRSCHSLFSSCKETWVRKLWQNRWRHGH